MRLLLSYMLLIPASGLIGIELQSWKIGLSVLWLGQFYLIASGLPKE